MTDFIFMLTRNDATVPEARRAVETALSLGVTRIGFKDVGLRPDEVRTLRAAIAAGGARCYLELVSEDPAAELAGAALARDTGVDVLLGGREVVAVTELLEGSGTRYHPFVGPVAGHPTRLVGTHDEIVADAARLAALPGVDGLDLLAWRFEGDARPLIADVVAAAGGKPVVVAGSISTAAQIEDVQAAGGAAFTVGSALFDERFEGGGAGLAGQLAAVLERVAVATNRICPTSVVDLAAACRRLDAPWTPRVLGRVNGTAIKLARFEGRFVWHHHAEEDELFLVLSGRLALHLRDRTERLGPGECLLVPRGVEHCPEALDGPCEVLLVEPESTRNTGNVAEERTVHDVLPL